ncbi:hypothetical protein BV20DRAFT_976969 [Pilatotrama ljubarskyi]|nr:hypothetical protein BV20DRAFT_976969 [Pilatotrama ljubarskyi]
MARRFETYLQASPQVARWLDEEIIVQPGQRGLLSLSSEITLMIVEEVYGHGTDDEVMDTLHMAASCKRLAQVAEPFLQEIRTRSACRWGKSRIVCIGEGATLARLPPRLLREAERQEIQSKKHDLPHRSKSCSAFASLGLLGTEEGWLDAPVGETGPADTSNAGEDMSQLSEASKRICRTLMQAYYPSRRDWVVCNWTSGELVRAQAIADLCKQPNDEQPFLPGCAVKLSHVLLARICWTDTDECLGIPSVFNFKLHQGPWAGNRFTITTMERLSEDGKACWRDVSTEVVQEIRELFTSEGYGEQLSRAKKGTRYRLQM